MIKPYKKFLYWHYVCTTDDYYNPDIQFLVQGINELLNAFEIISNQLNELIKSNITPTAPDQCPPPAKRSLCMDKECISLCDAINLIPSIRTIESCCGHGKDPYRIWFKAKNLKCLPRLLYWFSGCHSGHYGWKVIVQTDCACSPVTFMIEGPIGAQAYKESEHIAELLREEADA